MWHVKKLKDISKISYGYTQKASFDEIGPHFLRITDIKSSGVNWDYVPYCYIEKKEVQKYKLSHGDIVFARTGATTGKSYLIDNPPEAVFASYLIRVKLLNDEVYPEFLNLYFQTGEYWKNIELGSTGSAQGGFNATKLGDLKIPSPPLPEQQCIVGILDKAFSHIATATAHAEQNRRNARELFDSTLNNIFTKKGEGWVEKTLGDVCEIKPPKKEAKEKLSPIDLVSFVPMKNLNIGQKHFNATQVRSLEEVSGSYTYFADGDVLLAKITPCFENGKLGIASNLKNGIGFGSSEYIVFRPDQNLHADLLYYYLSREQFRKEGKPKMTGAVGHKRVPKDFIENYKINFPPTMDEQKSIVAKLEELSTKTKRLEAIYQQKLEALAELKQSLLQQAFAGEL